MNLPFEDDIIESASIEADDENIDKQQELFSNAINKEEDNKVVFFFLLTSGIISCAFVFILLVILVPLAENYNVFQMLSIAAPLSSIPLTTMMGVHLPVANEFVKSSFNFQLERISDVEAYFDNLNGVDLIQQIFIQRV